MSLNTIYLSLGSNIEPESNLLAALEQLSVLADLVAVSSVWKTKPVGLTEQPDFLNAAAIVKSPLTAEQFKEDIITVIEQSLGRVRQVDKNAPRTIDIDIMLFNDQILDFGGRHIPDKEVLERAFVAIPLAELAPDYRHPETGQRLSSIAEGFEPANAGMQRHKALSPKHRSQQSSTR